MTPAMLHDLRHVEDNLLAKIADLKIRLDILTSPIEVKIVCDLSEHYQKERPEIPAYATDGSAGFDLRAAENATIFSMAFQVISTNIKMAIPKGYELQIRPRSGLAAKHGVSVLNSPGTIDSDYRGEIKVILVNHGDYEFNVERGDRIAQAVLVRHERARFVEVASLDETARGEGGFGSTGK